MKISPAIHHCSGISLFEKAHLKIWKRKLLNLEHLLYTLDETPLSPGAEAFLQDDNKLKKSS